MYYILYGDEIYGYALMVKLTSVATLQNISGEKIGIVLKLQMTS